jgi:hypothetical protein
MNALPRFVAQDLGIGAISPNMVEQQLEGDKDADLSLFLFLRTPSLASSGYLCANVGCLTSMLYVDPNSTK